MTRSIAMALATAALFGSLTGSAHAGATPLATTPFDIDNHGVSMYCDVRNIGTQPVVVRTEFVDYWGVAKASTTHALPPGAGNWDGAPTGVSVQYCRVVPVSGNPRYLRAAALFFVNGHYMAAADAH